MIKQARCFEDGKGRLYGGLASEAAVYKMFQHIDDCHTPKMYGELQEDKGRSQEFVDQRHVKDWDFGRVQRLMLEYCPGPDLQRQIDDAWVISRDAQWVTLIS